MNKSKQLPPGIFEIEGDLFAATLPSQKIYQKIKTYLLRKPVPFDDPQWLCSPIYTIESKNGFCQIVYSELVYTDDKPPQVCHCKSGKPYKWQPVLVPLKKDLSRDYTTKVNPNLTQVSGGQCYVDNQPVKVDTGLVPNLDIEDAEITFGDIKTETDTPIPWAYLDGLLVCLRPLLFTSTEVILNNSLCWDFWGNGCYPGQFN